MGGCTHGGNNNHGAGPNDVPSKSAKSFHAMQYDDYQEELSYHSKQTIDNDGSVTTSKKKVKQIYSMIN